MELRYMERNSQGELETITIDLDPASVTSFGINAVSHYKRNMEFKKFGKTGNIRYYDGAEGAYRYINCDPFYIKELKKILKGKYKTIKNPVSKAKKTKYGYETRCATNWIYEIKK